MNFDSGHQIFWGEKSVDLEILNVPVSLPTYLFNSYLTNLNISPGNDHIYVK